MSGKTPSLPSNLPSLFEKIKARIQHAQTAAMLAVNAKLVRLYWDIGRRIADRQERAGWGACVVPQLARLLCNELAEVKGFSERNPKLMAPFAHECPPAFAPGCQ